MHNFKDFILLINYFIYISYNILLYFHKIFKEGKNTHHLSYHIIYDIIYNIMLSFTLYPCMPIDGLPVNSHLDLQYVLKLDLIQYNLKQSIFLLFA